MKKIVFIYVVLLHLLIAVLFSKTDFYDGLLSSFGYSQSNKEVSHYIQSMYRFQQQMNLQIPENQNFLIGDSIAKSLATVNLKEPVINWGIGHNNTKLLLNNINSLDSLFNARSVIINLGINDLNGKNSVEDIFSRYKLITQKLHKVPKVYIISVLPMGSDRLGAEKVNLSVLKLNDKLLSFANSHNHIVYINLFESMSLRGVLNPIYDRGDGLHINAKGYQVFAEVINKAAFNG